MYELTQAQLDAHRAKGYAKPNDVVIQENYQLGLDHAAAGAVCHITARGTWTASYPATLLSWPTEPHQTCPCFMTKHGSGYDMVGDPLDVYGAALLQGWKDGGALIVDHRREVAGDKWMDGVVVSE